MSGLSIDGALVQYGSGGQRTTAVDQVSLQVPVGQVLALLGPSGCGKSSLLRAVAGLEPLTQGRVCWDGKDLGPVAVHRRGFGLMFQDGQLFAHRDVAANIAFGLQMAGVPRAERQTRVTELLEIVGLPGYGARAVASLSGGQAQRVSLARSLAPSPSLLLLDEPLSALDRALRERLAADLHTILRRAGTTALYVTHDHDEAFTVADRVALMMDGQIVQEGTPAQLWAEPAGPEVATFLGYRLAQDGQGRQVGLSPQALVVVDDERTRPEQAAQGADTSAGSGVSGVSGADASAHSADNDGGAVATDSAGVSGESMQSHAVGHVVTGTVRQVGFSRGRTTVQVDLGDWGTQHAVAPGLVDLEPGQQVRVGVDPSGVVRL